VWLLGRRRQLPVRVRLPVQGVPLRRVPLRLTPGTNDARISTSLAGVAKAPVGFAGRKLADSRGARNFS